MKGSKKGFKKGYKKMLIILSLIIALLYGAFMYYVNKVHNLNYEISSLKREKRNVENELAALKAYCQKTKRNQNANKI